jgi:hypothetical protein
MEEYYGLYGRAELRGACSYHGYCARMIFISIGDAW